MKKFDKKIQAFQGLRGFFCFIFTNVKFSDNIIL